MAHVELRRSPSRPQWTRLQPSWQRTWPTAGKSRSSDTVLVGLTCEVTKVFSSGAIEVRALDEVDLEVVPGEDQGGAQRGDGGPGRA